ncbi:MAG TPA: phage tail tube protein [Prosthecobacter sp.]|nr:phage tail tube protein [Prosthecobacter sp.]
MSISPVKAGISYIKVGGQQYKAQGEFKYRTSKFVRETLEGADSTHGYSEKPKTPFIEGKLSIPGDMPSNVFEDSTNANVTLALKDGKVVTGIGMWHVGENEVDTENNTMMFRFEGGTVEESVASV